MGNSFAIGIRSALGAILAALVFVGMGVSLSGCPVAAELENEERFLALAGSGNSGTSGAAGSGGVNCNQDLPDGPGTIGCDYQSFMRTHCARGGCHNNATASGDLDLTLDTLLIARIVDVPATHKITCSGGLGQCNLSAPQCANCMMCPPGPTLLVSKADPPNSWMMQKMNAFNVDTPNAAPDIGCGTAMPYPPGGTGFTAERRTCLTNFFTWVANNGRACDVSSAGSGGGGAGGAGAGGAGAGSGGGGAGGT